MAFIQPCFIKKISSKLKENLKKFGYKDGGKVYYGESQYLYCGGRIFYESPEIITFQCNRFIDCGTNELIFLSLAALRDDTDANQWFICDKEYITNNVVEAKVGEWIYIFEDDLEKLPGLNFYDYFHKATAEEIIEHFKDKYRKLWININLKN